VGEKLDLAGTTFTGETPTDWMRDVSKIAKNLRELSERKEIDGIVTNLESLSAKANLIATRLERGEGTVGKLLSSDDSLYHEARAAITNAVKLLANLDASAVKLKNGQGTIGRLFNEEGLYCELEEAVKSFKTACDSFDAKATIAGANKLLDNLNVVAERLKNGEGTIGKLICDDSVYKEVDGLIKDIRQVIDNYRDTTPISTFSSLATGAL
jgi:phospholipid/cholesterol/gamma-HCH transport system substrate-binding protein